MSPCRCFAGRTGAELLPGLQGLCTAGTKLLPGCPAQYPEGNAWALRPLSSRWAGGAGQRKLPGEHPEGSATRACPSRCHCHLELSLQEKVWIQCTGKNGHGRAKLSGAVCSLLFPGSPGTDPASLQCSRQWSLGKGCVGGMEVSWCRPWGGHHSVSPLCHVQHSCTSPKTAAPLTPTHGGCITAG